MPGRRAILPTTFLTGDRRSLETGRAVADYFIRKDLGRPYNFSSTRTFPAGT